MIKNLKDIAGIVAYNPEIIRLEENIIKLLEQCDKVIIVDNGSDNIEAIQEALIQNANVILIRNIKNEGIAKGLNQLTAMAEQLGYEWILTMDQDSVILPGLIEKYRFYADKPRIGMISCNIIERNDFEKHEQKSKVEFEYLHKCITSGCYTNIAAIKLVGGFDETYFIDYVDFDMCYRLIKAGFSIIKVNFDGLLHSTGCLSTMKVGGQDVRVGGRNIYIYHESPIRIYYFFRNTIFFWRKYGMDGKEYTNPLHIIWRAFLVVAYEKPKLRKIKMLLRGIRDGMEKEII